MKNVEIGKRLEEFIQLKKWSKAEFARRVKIRPQHVNKYLTGEYKTESLYWHLSQEGCNISWLETGEGKPLKIDSPHLELQNILHERGWSIEEFAKRMGILPENAPKYLNNQFELEALRYKLEEEGIFLFDSYWDRQFNVEDFSRPETEEEYKAKLFRWYVTEVTEQEYYKDLPSRHSKFDFKNALDTSSGELIKVLHEFGITSAKHLRQILTSVKETQQILNKGIKSIK